MAVRMILDMETPAAAYLGEALLYFPNDALLSSLADKYPSCLARPLRESFPEVWDALGPLMHAVLSTGVSTRIPDTRFEIYRNGMLQEAFVNITFNPLRNARGETFGLQTIAIETTERILAERRLACLRDLSAAVFDAQSCEEVCQRAAEVLARAPDVPTALLFVIDEQEKSARCAATAGPEWASGEPIDKVSLEGERDPFGIAKAVASRRPEPFSGRALHPESRAQQIDGFALPIVERIGDRVGGILVAGITPLRPREELQEFLSLVVAQLAAGLANARAKTFARERVEALAALDRAKTAFFNDVSHELRTPLTLLLAPLSELLASERVTERDRALLELVRRGAWRLKKLVRTMLDFSRVEAGRADAFYEEIDLAAFTQEIASMFSSAFAAAKLDFVVDTRALAEPTFVDREMWEQIVLNLLSNALKFTHAGEVRLRLFAEGAEVVLTVSDTGCGIAPEHLPRVFDRFHRVRAPFARTHEGTGIGLSLVRELVRLHGGRVSAESAFGHGTTICVRVPRGCAHLPRARILHAPHRTDGMLAQLFREEALGWLDEPQLPPLVPTALTGGASSPSDSHGDAAGTSARILLADDNADMRSYLRRLLGERWQVTSVAEGNAALTAARELKPDLILSDVMMPGLDGFALLEALRRDPSTAHIPVMLISARAGEEAASDALRAGAADYIVKPFAAREVVARVETQLTHAKLRQAERAAREAAEETNRARERFFAMLAHEMRSPLSVILGYAQLLRRGRLGAKENGAAVALIEQSALGQQRLVEDLVDVSRIVAGTLTIERQEVDKIAPQLERAIDAVRLAACEKGVLLECRLDPDAGPLRVDRERLQQVLGNLLGNALKFTPPGGRISVTSERRGDAVEVRVRDSGRGIAPEALPHIFEHYWMGDRSQGRHGGLGLGLAIARSIVSLHGGSLTAESEGEGRGATFTIVLPLAPRADARPESSQQAR